MKIRKVDLALFVAAFVPRLVYLFLMHPPFQFEHWDMATSILRYGTLGYDGRPTTRFEPLYPLFVAGLRDLMGDRVLPAQVVQVAVGSLAAVGLYHLTEALTSSWKAALAAALVFAAYPLSIRHAADGTDTTLMGTLLVFYCLAFVRARTEREMAVAGLWLGLATLTRSMALPILAASTVALLWQRRPRQAVALAVLALACYAPYAARNYSLNGTLVPTRTGINLYVSNSRYTDALVPEYHADVLEGRARELIVAAGLPPDLPTPAIERQRDELLTRIAWERMRERPVAAIARRFEYLGYFFSPFVVPLRDSGGTPDVQFGPDGTVSVEDAPVRSPWVRAIYTLSFTPVMAFAIVGAWTRRHAIARDAVLWCVIGTFAAMHSIFFPATRYRTPVSFILIFFAIAGARAIWTRCRVSS